MNTTQLTGFLHSPERLDAQSLLLLTDLVKEYPYFQTAQVLLAKNLHNEKNFRYNAQLKIAAAYSADRKRLYELINGVQVAAPPVGVEKAKTIVPEFAEEIKVEKIEKEIPVKEIPEITETVEKEIPQTVEGKKIVESEKITEKKILPETQQTENAGTVKEPREIKPDETHTFIEWLKITSIHSVKISEIQRGKKKTSKKDELIDKFIREEPKISKPKKAEFFSPINMAKQSLVEPEDMVSETLAQIYEKQGFFVKAIKAYEKLSLKYPEKKAFFAARIENLIQKLNEQ